MNLETIKKIIPLVAKVKSHWQKTCDYISARPYLQYLLVFSFFFIVINWLYLSVAPLVSSDDHFFHIRFAEHIRQNGFTDAFWNFKSIYFSKMTDNTYFIYYNFLFYLVLIPFTFIQPLFLGIKLYAIFILALSFTGIYFFLKKFDVRNAFIWTAIAFSITGSTTLWRLLLSRPYVLAPIFLIILLYCLHKKRYWAVFAISFIYLYWHSMTFFFPLIVSVSYYLFEQFYERKGDWKNLIASFGGVLLAIGTAYIISPGFLLAVKDLLLGISGNTIQGHEVFIPEGNEVYPVKIFDYINANILVFIAFVIAISTDVYRYIRYKQTEKIEDEPVKRTIVRMTLFFVSIGFFYGVIHFSNRFSDYFIIFSLLYIVLTFDLLIKKISFLEQGLKKSVFVGLTIIVIYLFSGNVLAIQSEISRNGAPADAFSGVGTWLATNTQKGDIIFNPNWSWFPQLYYYSPDNNYIAGLDPIYFYKYNPQLYWLWMNISNKGFACEEQECQDLLTSREMMTRQPATAEQWYKKEGDIIAIILKTQFKTNYIVSSAEFSQLNKVLDNNDQFEKVYGNDKAYFIYKIK